MMVKRIFLFCCLLAIIGCQKADYTYTNLRARLTIENTYQAPALHTACNSWGEFCTITTSTDGKQFIFKGSSATSVININASATYSGFYLGLSGLIVGLPSIAEIGKTESQVVCFDLACSNCYQDYNITKRLTLQGATATCNSCKRTYDLNNTGFVSNGESGRALYRYRVSYINNVLVVSN
ncbi:MAG: hypothetical protein IKO73_03865 [Bacteroidaceae bacterium]|nr:hypothetical protein [Bacteroidaceae bacterium]